MRALAAIAAILVAWALVGCGDPRPGTGSTLEARYTDRDGDGRLERAAGEPLRGRTELAPPSRAVARLALLAQFTDAHVRDAQSPARVPFLNRLGEPFTSTFRPQEALSSQVLAAAVRSIDALHPEAVVDSGDLIDNDQQNELDAALAVLRGGRVDPDSGARGYDGVQASSNPDPFYYRPGVDAPRHPGLLSAAVRPFRSPGLRAPWLPVLGNHDVLVQGEIPATPGTQAAAVGRRLMVSLDPYVRIPRSERALGLVDRLAAGELPGTVIGVPPDPRRRELPSGAVVARLRATSGTGGRGPLLDYTFDVGRSMRGIVLDTIRRAAGGGGVVHPGQLWWLRRELRAAGRRFVIVFSHQPLTSVAGREQILSQLDRDPRVVATVAGDTHHNAIAPRQSPAGGYWMIQTASLADYPQQARALALVRTADGGDALETWMLDTWPGDRLADTARELAYLDAQGGRPAGDAGGPLDRNVRLYLGRRP